MVTNLKKLPDSQAELIVSLNKSELQVYIDQTERELARGLKMDGFRPGKAPREMVRKQIGEDAIRQEAIELAVKTSLAEAVTKEKLDVLDQLDLKVKENATDKLVYEARFLVMPEVELGPYKNLGVMVNKIAISDKEIQDVIAEVAKSRAVTTEVTRSAQKSDRAEIDFVIRDLTATDLTRTNSGQGAVIEGGASENHPLIVGEGKFVPGFEEQLVGMSVGDKKNFSLKIPADYYQKKIAGRELDFEVTLKRLEEVKVPEVDDKFVQGLGTFGSTTELRQNIEQGLTMEKTEKEKQRVRGDILDKISTASRVELPKILVDRQLDALISDLDQDLHQKGMELGPYLAHLGKTQDELKKEWRKRAEEQTRRSLVARAIAQAENIKVSDKEIEAEAQAAIQQLMLQGHGGAEGPEIMENLNLEALKEKIGRALLNEKIFQFLEKHNTHHA